MIPTREVTPSTMVAALCFISNFFLSSSLVVSFELKDLSN